MSDDDGVIDFKSASGNSRHEKKEIRLKQMTKAFEGYLPSTKESRQVKRRKKRLSKKGKR